MLGDSTSVLASTTTPSTGGGGGEPASAPAGAPPPQHQLPASGVGGGGGGVESAISEVGHVGSNINNNNNSSKEDHKVSGGAVDDDDRSFGGGNRWPRQETLALLKIRSDMDVAFRDASVKGPLWDEVSRKLGELGYNRSAKKCKEKFENVFKYHKRTKEGRTGKKEGKTYRFFDQLEAFEAHPSSQPPPPPPQQLLKPQATAVPMSVVSPGPPPPPASVASRIPTVTFTGTTGVNITVPPSFSSSTNATKVLPLSQATSNPTSTNPSQPNIQSSFLNFSPGLVSNSTSSSTSSDEEIQGRGRRKRKWKDFFERLMKEVTEKQEDMQKRFLDAIEKREHDRMVREEAWRMQEMARINREREILAQERSIAAAKDAAVMAFLQKLSEQQNLPAQQLVLNNNIPQPQPVQPQPTSSILQTQPQEEAQKASIVQAPHSAAAGMQAAGAVTVETKSDNGDQGMMMPASSSRWPKSEIEALINLRTNLDSKYQENGPKGPLWEEVSAGMRRLGYNRNAKRCKEKWENINKYFKKVKESNKKRPQDSKTCPYFQQLDALYKEKHININNQINSVPLMVRPEQQWPPPPPPPPPPSSHLGQQPQGHRHDSAVEDLESEDNQNHHEDDDDDYDDEEDKDMDDDEEDEASGYELVPNRTTSMSSAG